MRLKTIHRWDWSLFIFSALVCAALSGCGGGGASSTSSPNSNSPAVSVSASTLVFPSLALGAVSSAQSLIVTNSGGDAISVSSIAASGDFAQSNTCGTSLAAGANCTVSVTFTPTALGSRTGTLSITDSVAGSPQQVSLSGTGVSASGPAVTLAPASYTFSSQVVNTTSASEDVTLTNSGGAPMTLSGVSVTGDFAQTNSCGSSVAAGASCTVSVTFTPKATGSRSGTVSFADNAPRSPQTIQLIGTGVIAGQLVESPTSISFGSVVVGQTSSQAVTITNSGGQTISVNSASTSGAGVGVAGLSLPLTLAANQSTTFNITFDPTSSGLVNGTVSLTNSGTVASVTIPVTGTGTAAPSHEVTLAWSASTSQVLGYYTYRGTVTGGPYTKLSSTYSAQTTYADQNVVAGDTYFYVVTALGTDSVESAYSNEAKATVPTP